MVSPLIAVALGWLWLNQSLTPLQILGGGIVLASVWAGQITNRGPQSRSGIVMGDRRRKHRATVDVCALSEHRLGDLGLSRAYLVDPAPTTR